MKCKHCSAEFDDNLPQCPYCGALNYTGAEQEYFEHLHDLNDEMADMSDDSKETFQSGFKKSMTIAASIIGVAILVIGLLVGLYFLYYNYSSKKSEEEYLASRTWKNTYYEELDTLYAQNDYDAILLFLSEHVNDKGYFPYEWEHLDLICCFEMKSIRTFWKIRLTLIQTILPICTGLCMKFCICRPSSTSPILYIPKKSWHKSQNGRQRPMPF